MKKTKKELRKQAEESVKLAHEDDISQKKRSVHFKKAADLYKRIGDTKRFNECMGWFHMTDIKKNFDSLPKEQQQLYAREVVKMCKKAGMPLKNLAQKLGISMRKLEKLANVQKTS